MITSTESMVSANKAAAESFLTIADAVLTSTEDLAALNLNVARSLLDDGIGNIQALLGAKDLQQFASLHAEIAQPVVEKFVAYSRNFYKITAHFQEVMTKTVEERFAEINKDLTAAMDSAAKNGPAGTDAAIAAVKSAMASANSAYENMSNAGKQAVEIAETNFAAATKANNKAVSASTKAKKVA